MGKVYTFPKGFLWGTSTSAYQIEGAVHADGRGLSIWDTYSHTPGKIINNDTGDVAADHYHLWQQDVALMKDLGYKAYRFSIAWPRILPNGIGEINEAGLSFYDRLVDGLLGAGITPVITLFHWDLPTALKGAWLERATAQAFSAYTDVVTRRLGDRVKQWMTLNEPWCPSILGYALGEHAPGEKNYEHALRAGHHLLLAHALSTQVIRANVTRAKVSLVENPAPNTPSSESEADKYACRFHEGFVNRWFLDPIYGRGYPQDMVADFRKMGALQEKPNYILPGDLELIATPIDSLGVNYYSRAIIGAVQGHEMEPGMLSREVPAGNEVSDFGWEVYPHGLVELLDWINTTYSPKSMFIAENGAAYHDGPGADGKVHDQRRVSYLRRHLIELAKAIEAGIPVDSYFVWSFLDNFEWAVGYSQRFGIVHVDFATQKRTPKDSAYFYSQVVASNQVEEE